MNNLGKLTAMLLLSGTAIATSPLMAVNYVIYVHGRGAPATNCGIQTTDNNNNFGNTDTYGAANKSRAVASGSWQARFINYDGSSDPRTYGTCRAQTYIQSAFNTLCTSGNSCVFLCHSAGCMAMDYAFEQGNASGATGLLYVVNAASASGGSPLATAGAWATGTGMDNALKTSTARSWNHNNNPVTEYMNAGYACYGATECSAAIAIEGADDSAVNFASACGFNAEGTETQCVDANHAKYTLRSNYCNSKGAKPCNTSNHAYNTDHSGMKCVGRDAFDTLSGHL